MKRKFLALLLTAAMVLTLLPTVVLAAGDAFDVEGGTGYTYGLDGVLTFTAPGEYTVSMATPGSSTTTDTIVVNAPGSSAETPVSITLQGVDINVSGTPLACAFDVKDGSTVSLTLSGTNTLTSGDHAAGLHVPSGAALIIGGDGTLTANGGGGSMFENDGGAGIGSSTRENSGAVTITGGTIIAEGAQYSAGIGGGYYGTSGTVNISGGTVTANGQNGSAGIGGGSRGGGGTINITGGSVTAEGRSWGPGIGSGGYYTGTDTTVTISGGTVNATAKTHGAGIGGGFRGNGGTISISGGTVIAQGGKYGAGIGGGRYDSFSTASYGAYEISINGGTVTAMGGDGGAGIGSGFNGKDGDVSGGTVYITGGTVTAEGGNAVTTIADGAPTSAGGGAGIGGGCNGSGGDVYISGGSVKASGGDGIGTEDIGKGYTGASDGSLKNFAAADGVDVYPAEVTLSGVSAATAVSSIITDAAYAYGTEDIQTDSSGKLYLYLPAGKKTTTAVTLPAASTYTGEVVTTTDPITSCGTLSPSADVDTYAEFTTAVAAANIGTINVIGSFALEANVTIGRSVTVTSANGSVITVGSHCLLVSGAATDVTLSGNLIVTGSGTVISVGANSAFTLTGGTVSASGNNSRGIFVQSQGEAYVNGGSVSASGENAYGILLGTGDSMANLYIDMSNTPSIDEVYFDSFVPTPTSFLLGPLPTPFSAALGEATAVYLTGVGEGADFQIHTLWATPPPGTSEELNAASVPPDDSNTFAVTPNAVGDYNLVLFGSTARSNIFITIPVTVTSGFAGGDGTAGNPFQIANKEQLNRVRRFLGSAHTNKYFKLTENINLGVVPYNTGEGWEPIGNNDDGTNNMFQGNFDGNGKTISGLFIDRTDDAVGLFGVCSDANIQNLGLIGVNITGNNNAGSLAGYLGEASAVTNCYATGTVTSGSNPVGGLIGVVSNSTITNSYATCSVTGNTAGGLVGGMGGTSVITNSYAAGFVTGQNYPGGLVGDKLSDSTVTASYYNSQTSGQSDNDGRGEPKTSSQLVQEATFSGWDFTADTGVWVIDEGASYPYLRSPIPTLKPAPPAATGVTVTPETLTLTYGDTPVTLTATVVGPVGSLDTVTWTSTATSVATVDSSGAVTPVSVGTATITATSVFGGISDAVAVTVNPKTLTLTGSFTAQNKIYDGNTAATIDPAGLTLTGGILGGDEVGLGTITATFADANVGAWDVSLTGVILTGAAADNYTVDFSGVSPVTASINKATPATPLAPTLDYKTHTIVVLTANPLHEFRVDGGNWQDSNMFTGLSPATTYNFTARVKETANNLASLASDSLTEHTYSMTYAVTYHPNGGSGTAPTEINKPEGVAFAVKANSFTAPYRKQFKGWNTAADAQGTAYAPGTLITMPAADLNLYAIWETVPGSDDGGSSTDSTPPAPITTIRQYINAQTGVNVGMDGVSIIVPPKTLPANATLSITKLTTEQTENDLPQGLQLKLGSEVYEISTDGERNFGDKNITIKINYDPAKIAAGETPVVAYKDEATGSWVTLPTTLEQGTDGQWYATVKVNHLTKFVVFSAKQQVVALTIGQLLATVNSMSISLDAAPVLDTVAGRTLVPIRFISEALGAQVVYDAAGRQVKITDGIKKIQLILDSRTAFVNGQGVQLDSAPVSRPPGRTFVPLRFAGEALGATVDYNGTTKVITITRAKL